MKSINVLTFSSDVVKVSLWESLSFVTDPTFTYSRTKPPFSTSAAAIKPLENNLLINFYDASCPFTVKWTKSIPEGLGLSSLDFLKVSICVGI